MAATKVRFADLGLDSSKSYLVHEFWSGRTLGVVRDGFDLASLDPMGLQSYAIRELLDRPQLVTTSRHLSQGAAEIELLTWNAKTNTLEGRSRVVAGDKYRVKLHVPKGFQLEAATVERKSAQVETNGEFLTLPIEQDKTASVAWSLKFVRKD
jgi:hypothetical protein